VDFELISFLLNLDCVSGIVLFMELIFQNNLFLFIIIMLWVLPWKIYSLWVSARNGHKGWFVALILVNSIGILDIIYIFAVAKKGWKDVKETLNKKI
jgi:hypothetical protein